MTSVVERRAIRNRSESLLSRQGPSLMSTRSALTCEGAMSQGASDSRDRSRSVRATPQKASDSDSASRACPPSSPITGID